MLDLDGLDFDKGRGLVTVVAQDALTGAVLMVAHADRQALELTLTTGEMHYRSRSRGLWRKGAVSGNTQRMVSLDTDCDGDAVLARVVSEGPACHTGSRSCFGESALPAETLGGLAKTIEERFQSSSSTAAASPEAAAIAAASERPSYTLKLMADRNLRLKKLGEEVAELVAALAVGDRGRAAEEGADLLYHMMVALRSEGVTLEDLRGVLAKRSG